MLTIRPPSHDDVVGFLDRQRDAPLSYPTPGMTRGPAPAGYNADHRRYRLGIGDEVFERACRALRSWTQFRLGWVRLEPAEVEPAVGNVVAVIAKIGPIWWTNACRIIEMIDEPGPPRRFGLAYGTLAQHVERGEERFCVERDADGIVCYDLLAYSRPRHWLAWLGYPLARRYQRQFGIGSAAAMEKAVSA
jgi:uncharacterized protein (UPF0548 family)